MLLSLLLACSSPERIPAPPPPGASWIVDGRPTSDDPAVVGIAHRNVDCEGSASDVFCTGTLVGSHAVLTAAHCLEVMQGPRSAVVLFAPEPSADAPTVLVVDQVAHPDFDPETRDHDIAMLLLAEPAPVAPFPLPSGSVDDLAPGATLRVLGYGTTGRNADDPGVKREGTLALDAVRAGTFDAVAAPSMSCVGDSGGPVFATIGAEEQLVGITSTGDFACEGLAVNARVDPSLADFITPFLDRDPIDPWPAAAIPLDAICDQMCQEDTDCPAGMGCPLGRCVLPGRVPASYVEACDAGTTCDGACVALSPGDCRCEEPCEFGLIPPDSSPPGDTGTEGDRGCGCAHRTGSPPWFVVLGLLLVGLRRARPEHPVEGR